MATKRKPLVGLYVYWCRTCGRPWIAAPDKDVDVDCSECPVGKGDIAVDRYVLASRRTSAGEKA